MENISWRESPKNDNKLKSFFFLFFVEAFSFVKAFFIPFIINALLKNIFKASKTFQVYVWGGIFEGFRPFFPRQNLFELKFISVGSINYIIKSFFLHLPKAERNWEMFLMDLCVVLFVRWCGYFRYIPFALLAARNVLI